MSDRCQARDPYDDESWVCCMSDGHEGRHRPRLSDEAKAGVLEADSLNAALFDLACLFDASVTNNAPRMGDDGTPIYEVGEFIDLARSVIDKFAAPVTQ